MHVTFCMLPVEGWSNLESVISMQSSTQEVTILFKLIAAAKDSWACFPSIALYYYNYWFILILLQYATCVCITSVCITSNNNLCIHYCIWQFFFYTIANKRLIHLWNSLQTHRLTTRMPNWHSDWLTLSFIEVYLQLKLHLQH